MPTVVWQEMPLFEPKQFAFLKLITVIVGERLNNSIRSAWHQTIHRTGQLFVVALPRYGHTASSISPSKEPDHRPAKRYEECPKEYRDYYSRVRYRGAVINEPEGSAGSYGSDYK